MTPLVDVDGVAFAYPSPAPRGTPGFGLSDVTFAIEPGEIFGVIGPNSAGKTTLLRLLTRVLTPERGDIRLEGRSVAALSHAEIARRVGVVPQETPRPLPFTVEELVLMGRFPHGPGRYFESAGDLEAAQAAMAATGVEALGPLPFEQLGGGERQRALLARALAQHPRLLVLDEPTAHLDLRYQAEAVTLLRRVNREQAVGVLLVSHDLNLAAEMCDRLLLLGGGRVVRVGAPAEVLQPDALEAVFGCRVVVDKSPGSGRPVVQVAWPGDERR